MKKLLLAASALFGLAASAQAGVITIAAQDDGVNVLLICAGGVNAPISCSGSSTHFSTVNVSAVGEPQLPGGSLASVTIDATASGGGTHVLDVDVDQSGLNILGTGIATSTFTVNHLVGGPFGPTSMSTLVNGVTLASANFPVTLNDTTSSQDLLPGLITSTGHSYAITFTGAGQSATDTIQLIAAADVPEPLSLAILGTGLLGLSMVRRRA